MDRFKDMVRLGDGTFTNQALSDAAIARGIDALRNLTNLARNKGFDRIVAVATSAVREAKNGGEFIQIVEEQTGLNVQVITGKEEARLIYVGVRNSMELSDAPSLIADVGGGSVEVIACNRKANVFWAQSQVGNHSPKRSLFKAGSTNQKHVE